MGCMNLVTVISRYTRVPVTLSCWTILHNDYILAQLLLQLPITLDSHAQMSDHQAAAEKILQTFCQICMHAVTAERDVSLDCFLLLVTH